MESKETLAKAEGKQVNVAILLDASGSMNEKVSGGVKMDLAKQAIQQFAADLPEGTNVSLRVFGHKEGKSKKESCQSSETVYPLSSYDANSFQSALNKFGAEGWTPLAKGIRDARNDLAQHASDGVENLVYVVSDGEETCGGDPVKEAKELHTSDMKAVVNIIGFDVSNSEQRALKEVAKAGGGTYQSANSAKELEAQLRKERWRVEKEVIKWSSLSYDDISKRHQELIKENGQLREQLYEMRRREKENLRAAHRYLLRRIDSPSDLSIKLTDRQQKVNTYLDDLYDSSKKDIYEEYDKAYQELKKKKDEALNNE